MKKRLISIVSLILATVMCLALVACGGDTSTPGNVPGPNPSTSATITIDDSYIALGGLLATDWEGKAAVKQSSKNATALTAEVAVDKRGDYVMVDDMIIDIKTGYAYQNYDDDYYSSQVMPAGVVDYIFQFIGSLKTQFDLGNGKIAYDEDSRTALISYDFADVVNSYLEPLYNAYHTEGKTLKNLLNDYLLLTVGLSYDDIYTTAMAMLRENKATTVSEALTALNAIGIDLIGILEDNGVELPDELWAQLSERTVGEIVGSAYVYLMQAMQEMMPEDNAVIDEYDDDFVDEPVENVVGMESILNGLIDAMLSGEVDDNTIEEAFNSIDALVELGLSTPVKGLIDGALANNNNVATALLYTMIVERLTVDNIKTDIAITFDEDDRISEVSLSAYVKHGIDIDANIPLFDDDEYSVEITLSIDEYKVAEPFDIAFDEYNCWVNSVGAVIYELNGDDVEVHVGFGNRNVAVLPQIEVNNEFVENNGGVVYDAQKSAAVFDGEFLQSVFENAKTGATVTLYVYDVDEAEEYGYYYYYGISVYYMTNDPLQMVNYWLEIVMNAAM